MLRVNDVYVSMLGSKSISVSDVLAFDWSAHMDTINLCRFSDAVMESQETGKVVRVQFSFFDFPGTEGLLFLRCDMRVIATIGDRYLVYCLNENVTAHMESKRKSQGTAEQSKYFQSKYSEYQIKRKNSNLWS